jgi:hypothetical protein
MTTKTQVTIDMLNQARAVAAQNHQYFSKRATGDKYNSQGIFYWYGQIKAIDMAIKLLNYMEEKNVPETSSTTVF